MNSSDYCFTKEWTLFLDRDGVISYRLPGDYVKHREDFRFLDGAREAIALLSVVFGKIIIVSNQQGVGKGMMSAVELTEIDKWMRSEIENSGGRIDAAFYATQLASENHPDRKPGPGMALKAKSMFPEIDFSKSVMVGDSDSDMEFGKRLGMTTIFINEKGDQNELADFQFSSLRNFASFL